MTLLFYDDEFHAIRACIESGKGYKESAARLWPAMKPESAYARLKACTSGHGDQRLRFGEIIELMRFNGHFDPLWFACDETSHQRPVAKAPADEEAQIVTAIEGASTTLAQALKALESMQRRNSATVTRIGGAD